MTAATWTPVQTPTAADDCLLTATSGAVTIDAGSVCRSLNLTGYVNTLTHTAGVTLTIGDATAGLANVALAFPTSGWTYTLGSATTSQMSFVSTSATQQTVNFGGQTTGPVTFNATSNGSWQYTGSHVMTNVANTLTLTQGTLDLNGQTVSVGRVVSTGSATRALTLGAAAITCIGTNTIFAWNLTSTGMTFSGASATITLNAAGATFTGGGLTYGTLVLSSVTTLQTITGSNTFGTLTRNGVTGKTASLALGADQIITGTLTLAGGSAINRLLVTSDTLGTPRTLTAAVVSASNVDLRDITGAGAATWDLSAITGNSGDCGGNSLKALGSAGFTPAATQTATGTASFTWSAHGWTTRVPLPQDDVVINNAFIAGRTVTLDMPRAGKSISWTGATGTPAWAVTTATTVYGSVTKILGMTQSGTTSVTFEGRGAFTFTNAGITWTNPLIIAAVGGSVTLQDAILSTSTLTHNNGTWVDAGFASTFTTVTSNSGLTRALTSTGALTVNSTGAVFTITSTGLTFSGSGSSITISDTSSSSKTFAGGGIATYGTLIITASGTGTIDITGANTFAGLTVGAPKTIRFTAATTTTFSTAPVLVGTSGNLVTISSITAATHTLSLGTGYVVQGDYLSLTNSIATGGARWVAGIHSTDSGGNTGWLFNTIVPIQAQQWWKATGVTMTQTFNPTTITITPSRWDWRATNLTLTRGLLLTPARWDWKASTPTLTRALVLTPGRWEWQAGSVMQNRTLGLTPGQWQWHVGTMDRPYTVDLTPAHLAWIAAHVQGIPQHTRAHAPLVLLVRQVGDAWVIELP